MYISTLICGVNEQVLHFSVSSVLSMVHKQIERIKRKLSEIELENAQYKARLEKLKHFRSVIKNIATQIHIQSLEEQRTVLQSHNTALM